MRKTYLTCLTIVTVFCIIVGSLAHLGSGGSEESSASIEPVLAADTDELPEAASDGKNFKKVFIHLDAGLANISFGDMFSITGSNTASVTWDINEGSLIVHGYQIAEGEEPLLYITLPYDGLYTETEIDVDRGDIQVDHLSTGTMRLFCDQGNITVQGGSFDTVYMNETCGNITLEETAFNNMDIDCSEGNIDVQLSDPVSEYSMELTTAVGEISVGEEVKSKVNGQYTQHIESGSRLSVQVDTGNITVW